MGRIPAYRFQPFQKGRVGNINASKNPWSTYWSRRALKKEDRWVLRFVRPYVDSLLSDKPDATEGEKRMIEICSAARICWLLAIGREDWRAASSFMATEQRSLAAIRLERRAKDVSKDLKACLQQLSETSQTAMPPDCESSVPEKSL